MLHTLQTLKCSLLFRFPTIFFLRISHLPVVLEHSYLFQVCSWFVNNYIIYFDFIKVN